MFVTAGRKPTTSQLGKRTKWARRRMGITLEKLGELTSLSKSHLCEIENGSKLPSAGAVVELANALHVPVGFLFGETDWPSNPQWTSG